MSEFRDNLLKHKTMAELQYVVTLYANVDFYDEYKVEPKNITNIHWRIYYMLLGQMVEKKGLTVIDEMNMELHMSQQKEKLQKLYENAGGWGTIEEAKAIIETDNIEGYYREVLRYSAILKLHDSGFDIESNWEEYSKLTYEELSDVISGTVDEIFSDIDMGGDKVVDIKDNIWDMVMEAHKGVNRGLPVASKLLNSVINGQVLGNITMIGGTSGVGKSFVTLNQVLPSVIKEQEPLLIMCNEEDVNKWQREMLIWAVNNILKKDMIKSRFYQGNFTKEELELLKEAHEWVKENLLDNLIRFVNFNMFSMGKSIKLIRKYATQFNVKYYIIDTLKLDNDIGSTITDQSWLQLQQNMVKLYNVIKPTAKNVHVWVTYQLNKSNKTRYLDQSSLGMSKNVADVVSTLMLIRDVLETEKGGDAKSLVIRRADGAKGQLSEEKEYMVVFIDKNRQGSTSNQVVWRVDKGRNIIKDVGFTKVAQDY